MRIIGYDFDGVFISIENEKARLFGEIVHKCWRVDARAASKTWILNLGTSRRHKFELMYRKRYRAELPEEAYADAEHEFSTILMKQYYPNAALVPETTQAAKELNKEFDVSFISSGVPHLELNTITARFKLDQYFDRILGTNEIFKSKTDHFDLITEANDAAPGIFIGDGLEDMKVAHQFGFIAIGLPTNHTAKDLRHAGAHTVCELPELRHEIRRLIGLGEPSRESATSKIAPADHAASTGQ